MAKAAKTKLAKKSSFTKKPLSKKNIAKYDSPMNGADETSAASIQHYNGVLIEGLRSDFKFVIEHMLGVEERLNKKFDDLQSSMNQRFETIEAVLKYHSQLLQQNDKRWEQNDKRWDQNDQRLDRIETRLEGVETRLEGVETRLDGVETRLDGVETRLDGVETKLESMNTKLDCVIEKVDRHDHEIIEIKSGKVA